MKIFKICSFVLLLVLTLALCVLPTGAQEACGESALYNENGFCITCNAPQSAPLNAEDGYYEVSNVGQLYWVADLINTKEAATEVKVRLMANLIVNKELLNESGVPTVTNATKVWTPIGSADAPATNVVFDGQGYMISGLYAKSEADADVGFFGVAEGVTVRELGVVDSYFGANTGFAGGIIAKANDACNVSYCYVVATVESEYSGAGGIAGALEKEDTACTVSFCYTTHAVAIYGADAATAIDHCYYRADSETDTLEGTAFYTSTFLLEDGETSLYNALSEGEKNWVESCRNNLPALRIEHIYTYPCVPECSVCGNTNRPDQKEHTYLNECDRTCEVCNRESQEPVVHKAYQTCQAVCQFCGEEIGDLTKHQYTNNCDATCDCGYERTVPGHSYRNACDTRCIYCNELREAAPHTYDNGCDQICDACGMTRAAQHTYDSVCDTECNVCKKTREAGHVYGEYTVSKEASALSNGEQERTCTLCGHKDVSAIPSLGVPTWGVVIIGVGVGLVVSLGGFALYWIVFKKRKLSDFFRA